MISITVLTDEAINILDKLKQWCGIDYSIYEDKREYVSIAISKIAKSIKHDLRRIRNTKRIDVVDKTIKKMNDLEYIIKNTWKI